MHRIVMCLIAIAIVACNPDGNKAVDREKIKQEMKDRQIKRVSEPELMDAAFQTGSALADKAETIIKNRLNKIFNRDSMNADSPGRWVIYPPMTNIITPVLDSLSQETGHEIGLFNAETASMRIDTSATSRPRSPTRYNIEKNLPAEDNVQRSGTDYLLFTRPFTSNNSICMSFFQAGESSVQIDSVILESDDFCGMWSIKLSKREIIKSL